MAVQSQRLSASVKGSDANMPRRKFLVLAFILLMIGAAFRFYHYHILQQYLLKGLIAISLLIFAGSLLVWRLKVRSLTYKDVLLSGVVLAILCGFTYESTAGNKRKNQKYLERVAGIVNRYTEKHHKTPEIVDEAVKPWDMLPNRGDADGNPYQYIRLSDRIFVIRSLGTNQKNDFGAGDDVHLNYLNGSSVSFDELTRWIKDSGTPEENEALGAYWPALQHH